MGRIPKLVKERALKELQEQKREQKGTSKQNDEEIGRESSCSSVSDRSIENYDPNTTGIGSEHPAFDFEHESICMMITDDIVSQNSPTQQHGDFNIISTSNNVEKSSMPTLTIELDQGKTCSDRSESLLIHRTQAPSFLPDDFTVDETSGVPTMTTGHLRPDMLILLESMGTKLNHTQTYSSIELNNQEFEYVQYVG
jgi:hypothetical protein